MARPRIQITEKDLRQARTLAGLGLSEESIAVVLEISYATLRRRKQDNEEFDNALALGRIDAQIKIAKTIFEIAIEQRNLKALIWLEKTRYGWSDKGRRVQHSGSVSTPSNEVLILPSGSNIDTDDGVSYQGY